MNNISNNSHNRDNISNSNKDNKSKNSIWEKKTTGDKRIAEAIFVTILVLYPLRHIHWGLDLWDTGYNYANFTYMGMEHMDSMWLFSTYLANVVGNFLTKLPAAGSLAGMNFYTGLIVSVLAIMGYWFCTRKLGIPKGIAFVGEFIAISFCWCPTALLYNYMTYVLFSACIILLYQGLTKEKMWYLFGAGLCLGTNILVRFSNLPEAAMIVAVWVYAFIVSREQKKANAISIADTKQVAHQTQKMSAWGIGFCHTLWCLGGYLTALVVLYGYIHIRYGMDAYITGIQRLFAMTDNATDYKATSMLMGVIGTYVENLYWVIRIVVIVVAGMMVCAFLECLARHFKPIAKRPILQRILQWSGRAFCVALAVAMLYWLYVMREFCSFAFYSYDSILRPGILFLMLAMFIAVVRIFHPRAPKEEKLISGMLVLVVILTSFGSNNGVYPSMNNLFLVAPYTFWECWKFARKVKEWEYKKLVISAFPAKCIGVAFLAMFLFQVVVFGVVFVFAEATGVQNVTSIVDNNDVLKGVKMSPERAQWMSEISGYVNENQLQGREVILFGNVPALSYYLQMPSAFNPWSDLQSYSVEQMDISLKELAGEIDIKEAEKPVIIADISYEMFLPTDMEQISWDEGYTPDAKTLGEIEKWILIVNFMDKYGYKKTFSNEKFVVWE